ncbi:hypothetical protein AG1IA_09326 [Rhizoctonia solani AG-1 IA]|uniref:Uncharacterized protein n=1 Tax=Thanatephorus cucumeris (strain AG1-IA) TaxID=983506 RepID=L8WEM0_THACA|nr:hypothetical protein AG1IA_09326 [Rhizoctonia solani AG-1 IA]
MYVHNPVVDGPRGGHVIKSIDIKLANTGSALAPKNWTPIGYPLRPLASNPRHLGRISNDHEPNCFRMTRSRYVIDSGARPASRQPRASNNHTVITYERAWRAQLYACFFL